MRSVALLMVVFALISSLAAEASGIAPVILSVEDDERLTIEYLSTGTECPDVSRPGQDHSDATLVDVDVDIEFPPLPTLPGNEAVTNVVAEALLDFVRGSWVDCFDQVDTNGIPFTTETVVPTWTWDGFLGADETNGLTRVAKKACFDWYLNCIATNRCSFTDRQTNLVAVAVRQCEALCYTNSWMSLMGIARNPSAPWRDLAGIGAIDFVPDESSLSQFGLDVFTNAIPFSVEERGRVVRSFVNRLAVQNETIPVGTVNTLLRMRDSECEAAMALDKLFSAKVSGYQFSSNRLATAKIVLENADSWEFQNAYFINVTNQLMNATQPLPEVEALRGL